MEINYTLETIMLVGYVLSVAGQNEIAKHSRRGFVIALASNAIGVGVGLWIGIRMMVLFSVLRAAANARGIWEWRHRDRPENGC